MSSQHILAAIAMICIAAAVVARIRSYVGTHILGQSSGRRRHSSRFSGPRHVFHHTVVSSQTEHQR